jgi:hypothetical protein
MDTQRYITVYMRDYRMKNPNYDIKDNERKKERYENDIEYRERKKQQALNRYYRLKQEKIQQLAITTI